MDSTGTGVTLGRRAPGMGARRRRALIGWMFVAPALLMYGVFVLQPLLQLVDALLEPGEAVTELGGGQRGGGHRHTGE